MYYNVKIEVDPGTKVLITKDASDKMGSEIQQLLGSKTESVTRSLIVNKAKYKMHKTALSLPQIKEILKSAYANEELKFSVHALNS